MADCVLYGSSSGRFRSSTKNTIFALPGGPQLVPVFFSSGVSRFTCSAWELV